MSNDSRADSLVERGREALEGITEGVWVAFNDGDTCGVLTSAAAIKPVATGMTAEDAIFAANAKLLMPELVDEIETLKTETENYDRLLMRHTQLLEGVVNAVRGLPADNELWSYADAPELVRKLVATLAEVRETAKGWAEQATDYDEDTEQQIEDGRTLLEIIDQPPVVTPREEKT